MEDSIFSGAADESKIAHRSAELPAEILGAEALLDTQAGFVGLSDGFDGFGVRDDVEPGVELLKPASPACSPRCQGGRRFADNEKMPGGGGF